MAKLTITNDQSTWEVAPGTPIPDLCDDQGAPIPFSCRAGACGTCRVRVLSGADQLSPMDDNEREFIQDFIPHASPQDRLACQCRIQGDVTIEIVDSGNHNSPPGSPA